jgi:hypothetical protein
LQICHTRSAICAAARKLRSFGFGGIKEFALTLTFILGVIFVLVAVGMWALQRRHRRIQAETRRREDENMALMRAAIAGKQKAQSEPAPQPQMNPGIEAAANAPSAADVLRQAATPMQAVQYQDVEGGPATAVLADQAAFLDAGDTFPQPVATPQSRAPVANGLPMREMAIALYEARGYRRETALKEDAPILCFLQHRTESNRAYGFVALQSTDPVGRERVKGIMRDLRLAGHKRIVMYASAGFAPDAIELAEPLRIRMYGPPEVMQALTQLPAHQRQLVIERAKQHAASKSAKPGSP